MTTRIVKLIGMSFVLLALALLLNNRPALAQPQPLPGDEALSAAAPAAQDVSIALCADEGTVTMPDGATIPFWGFGFIDTANNCVPQLPGPVLAGINPGNTVEISLRNDLAVPTSMIFPGQTSMATSAASPGLFIDEVPAGGTATYSFVAGPVGTYLYESGRVDEPQVAMGLYGALIVGGPPAAGQPILVLGEIDPDLNADPFNFDLLDYNPTYWLLNGRAYPDTLAPGDTNIPPLTSQPYSSLIAVNAGETVQVRYVNAASIHHTMSLLGLRQTIVAKDADADPNSTDGVAETIPSGQTTDVDIAIPVTAAVGDRFPLFNRQLYLTNGDPGPTHLAADGGGGMMTFIEVVGAAANVAPVAVDDGGVDFTIAQGGTLNIAAPGVLTNDTDGGDGPGPLTAVLVSGPANASSFALNPDGSFTYVHNGSATTSDSFTYQANDGLANSNVATVNITIIPAPTALLYVSLDSGATLNNGALTVADEDILSFDGANFATFFDGSAAGIPTAEDIDGFAVIDADTILLSFDSPATLPGSLSVDDSDIVQFDGTLGPSPVGTFSLFFDGSDVGLTSDPAEDIDAFELLSPTQLVISTAGSPTPTGSGTPISPTPLDEDMLLCTGSFGPTTTCTWTMYYDSSDVGLGAAPPLGAALSDSEDIDGVARAANGDIYLSVTGAEPILIIGQLGFEASSGSSTISGFNEDVFICGAPLSTGSTTSCTFSSSLFFDGSAFGLGDNNIDAIELP
jgi:hypothetical protein